MLDKNDLQAIAEMMDAKLEKQKEELRAEIAKVRADVRAEIADVRAEIADVRADVRAEIADVRTEIAASEKRMEAFVTGKIESSEQRTAQKILASETRLKNYIDERAREAESRAVSFAENEISRRQGVIQEGLDLALELPRVPAERVERIEQDVAALKFAVQNQAQKIKALQRSA